VREREFVRDRGVCERERVIDRVREGEGRFVSQCESLRLREREFV